MAFRVRKKKGVNALRVGFKVIVTLIALWASGYALNIIFGVINGTNSPFYKGVQLVGLTVADVSNATAATPCVANSCTGANCGITYSCITGQNSTSLLAIVGIFAVLWIVLEFVDVQF